VHRERVEAWITTYERVWRTAGTDGLADLFAGDVSYSPSPWSEPIVGLAALAEFWDAEREGPDEVFSMASGVVAVDGGTAVVRVAVDYERTRSGRWRDLWIVKFDDDGKCVAFEEWPFAPSQPDGHEGTS
jgi:hypothetical protein